MSKLHKADMRALLDASRLGLDAMHEELNDVGIQIRTREQRRKEKELKAKFYSAWQAFDELAERYGVRYYTPSS